jgi:hypothetical protein
VQTINKAQSAHSDVATRSRASRRRPGGFTRALAARLTGRTQVAPARLFNKAIGPNQGAFSRAMTFAAIRKKQRGTTAGQAGQPAKWSITD